MALYEILSGPEWSGMVNTASLLQEASRLELSTHDRLLAYLHLALSKPEMIVELKKIIEEESGNGWISLNSLPCFIGSELGVLPLCSLMIRDSQSSKEAERWGNIFRAWYRSECDIPFDAPLGSSTDHDNFVLGILPGFIVLCAGVAGQEGQFRNEMCEVLLSHLNDLHGDEFGVRFAVWICHLTARYNMEAEFNQAKDFINNEGGVTTSALFDPDATDKLGEENVNCPDISVFQEMAKATYRGFQIDPYRLAVQSIYSEMFIGEWSRPILANLWAVSTDVTRPC